MKGLIDESLFPYISSRCAFLELPYYPNIGDLLIWEGTEKFIKEAFKECVYRASRWSYKYRKLDKDITIFLQGGGNFGDIWRPCQDFRLKVVHDYPDNQIVILPQSVCYKNLELLANDAREMARHKKLVICARDVESYRLLKEQFSANTILLLPDMAFYIDSSLFTKFMLQPLHGALIVEREDKEKRNFDFSKIKFNYSDVAFHDWPSMEKRIFPVEVGLKFIGIHRRIGNFIDPLMDLYFQNYYRRNLIRLGIEFVSSYNEICTTRLHVAILCIILNKPCMFIDNSYSKNWNFYKTWLQDLDNIKFLF